MTRELQELCAALDAVRAGFLKTLAGLDDSDARMAKPQAKASNLRTAILVVIQETARHSGHADIIREQIDGHTGR